MKTRANKLMKRFPPAYIVAGCNCGDEMVLPLRYAKAACIPIQNPAIYITTITGKNIYSKA